MIRLRSGLNQGLLQQWVYHILRSTAKLLGTVHSGGSTASDGGQKSQTSASRSTGIESKQADRLILRAHCTAAPGKPWDPGGFGGDEDAAPSGWDWGLR
jgi:hypothetical protein